LTTIDTWSRDNRFK